MSDEVWAKQSCTGKRRYDRRAAEGACKEARRKGRARRMRAYPCDLCRGWHITRIGDRK